MNVMIELFNKKCNNPLCDRLVDPRVEYCCCKCKESHEGGYYPEHTIECNNRCNDNILRK